VLYKQLTKKISLDVFKEVYKDPEITPEEHLTHAIRFCEKELSN